MSDAIRLPQRPNLEHYKKLARSLQRACKSADAGAIREWADRWAEAMDRERLEHFWTQFEEAADAIVHGDAERLRALLAANPGLVNARSMREHHSTLLHYVSANGV